MKNKSKLKKLKAKKNTATNVPAQWLCLCPQKISVRDIWKLLHVSYPTTSIPPDNGGKNVPSSVPPVLKDLSLEIWEAAGVLEITLSDGKTIDFETAPLDLRDEYSNQFLAKHHTKSLFYVTIHPDSFALAKPVLEYIAGKLHGLFCGDTDDFTPVIRFASNIE